MSEPESTVTTPAIKEKNPTRVAQGKRLAEISKAAKEKKRLRKDAERKENTDNVGVNYKFVFGFIGVGVVGLYVTYSRKNAEPCESHPPPSKNREITLDGFD